MATTPPSWLDDAFKSAKEEFKKSLKNPALYDFSKINSPDDVIHEAIKIQKQQEKTKTLRGLRRIDPLISGLKEYAAVIEQFVQAKPEIMSLIWGPLKLILQVSSAVITAFDKVVKVIAELSMTLPSFNIYAQLFESNYSIRRAACLFYADILDFYAILLNFLTQRRLNVFLESLWPNIRSKIAKVQENIEHHKAMMTVNVTLKDILEAHKARKLALEEHARAEAFRESQTFSAIRNELNPHNYDAELADTLRRSSVASGNWLDNEPDFIRWRDFADSAVRCLWLHGIPGSGKTFQVSNLVKRMQDCNQRVLFVFLSHDNQADGDTIKVLHSLIFQLLEHDATLRPILHKASQSDYRKLKSDCGFVLDLLCTIINSIGANCIILDGLDELNEISWKHLLSNVLEVSEKCPAVKLLISSREEREISLRLEKKSIPIRVNSRNNQDIHSFVQLECEDIIDEKKRYGADERMCIRIREALETITEKSEGKLLLEDELMVRDQGTLYDIEMQMKNLPDGLDQAYGRLLDRIKNKLAQALRNVVRTILQWVACAQRPLREEEILQILAIEPGKPDFTKGRKEFRDIFKACGPIIEVQSGTVRFIHFSAKEYLLHEQSGGFLNLVEAHLDATLLCTTYLSFSSLNSLFHFYSPAGEADDIQRRAKDGDYVMFEYTSAFFLEHLETYLQSQGLDVDNYLITNLRQLQKTRHNISANKNHIAAQFRHMFKGLANTPDLQNFLSAVARFQTQAQHGSINQDDHSMNDPLQIFPARRRLRQAIESMLCQEPDHVVDCHCRHLERLYGAKIYHCDQYFCWAYKDGLESKEARDKHLEIHKRPHKCSMVNCLFSEIGFRDVTELRRHTEAVHTPSIFETSRQNPNSLPIQPSSNMFDALKSAIILDQQQALRDMLIGIRKENMSSNEWEILLCHACWKASSNTLSCLLDNPRLHPDLYSLGLAVALDAKNLPNVKLLLSRGTEMSDSIRLENTWPDVPDTSFNIYPGRYVSGYIRALGAWSPNLVAYLVNECQVEFPEAIDQPELIFGSRRISLYTPDELMKRFDGIKQYIIWPEAYTEGVIMATIQAESAVAVRICLENGGDPNATAPLRHGSRIQKRALYHAISLGDERGAEIAKVLLKYGARTEGLDLHKKKIRRKMASIEKCFGCEWGDIVRRIQAGEDLAITPLRSQRRT
ncbi:uncharacterized protein F4812DRAFT_259183 [Daldinia caldariorum]|uniref:uncharacterized protein n=1 Tax=Daldinia caldariorum TaxID=326644 RepID=UPI002007FAC3|nr:uncharacterized protein F4812DRAFT_259183 [Daldinia caldariorum]KAI1470272.1 hypothetical protein F4812DRAFT_259183 [Daldinia caldariorum]